MGNSGAQGQGTARPNVPKQSFDNMIMVRYGRGHRAQGREQKTARPHDSKTARHFL